jgi:DNA uptake protein ComE-like DNA-binding protein
MIVAVWLLVILLVVALGLAYDTQMATQATANTDGQARAYYAAYSGIERLAAELDNSTDYYTSPGQTWETIDSNEEPLTADAESYRYLVLAKDACGRLDLNEADEAGLGKVPNITEDQVAAILSFRGTSSDTTTSSTGSTSTNDTETTARTFQSVDDLLLVDGFTADLLYGSTSWPERLSPAERFRQDWAQREAGQTTDTTQPDTTQSVLADWFAVNVKARRIASDGQPRVSLTGITRDDLSTRLEAVAPILQVDSGAATDSGGQGGQGGQRGGGSPVDAALNVTRSRNIRSWSQVWTAVNNNRDAVRLLADVITLPNDGTGSNDAGGGAGGGGGGGRGPGGGGPGGGGPGGGRGPGGGGPGGPGGGRGPGGGGPGGGGPGSGGPGGGGPGGGRGPGGGPGVGFGPASFGAIRPLNTITPAVYQPRRHQGRVLFVQAGPGGGGPGGGGGAGGGGGNGGGGNGGGTTPTDTSTTTDTALTKPIAGAINLNTAPAEVIMTLPQMTEEIAQAIVAYRDANPMISRGDLLKVDEVTPAIFNAIVEKVTVISDTFLVRSYGTSQVLLPGSGRPNDIAVHLSAVIDRTSGKCRIVRLRQDN